MAKNGNKLIENGEFGAAWGVKFASLCKESQICGLSEYEIEVSTGHFGLCNTIIGNGGGSTDRGGSTSKGGCTDRGAAHSGPGDHQRIYYGCQNGGNPDFGRRRGARTRGNGEGRGPGWCNGEGRRPGGRRSRNNWGSDQSLRILHPYARERPARTQLLLYGILRPGSDDRSPEGYDHQHKPQPGSANQQCYGRGHQGCGHSLYEDERHRGACDGNPADPDPVR